MNPLSLSAGDPLSLTIAADPRLSPVDYTDDQIWELRLSGGEPPALAIETTYGLRANRMRLFPRFFRSGIEITDPAGFHAAPKMTGCRSNYLAVAFQPFEGLEAQMEYWAIDSHSLAGRIRLTNASILTQSFRLEWAALLTPSDRLGGFSPLLSEGVHALGGETANLKPVVVLSGGGITPSGPYPSLEVDVELYPGNTRLISWCAAAFTETQASLEAALQALERHWEAETARIELLDTSSVVAFQTGKPDWDATLQLAQRSAFQLLQQNTACLPYPAPVLTRRPDQGYSALGDGRDHAPTWRGSSALDAWYLLSLLPGAPELAQGLVRNFLSIQDEEGRIDSLPGLGGQRSLRRAQPLLATTGLLLSAWESADDRWKEDIFEPLLRYFKNWMRQESGLPAWENPLQTGLDDSPIFNRFDEEARGVETFRLSSPALLSMLYSECQSLLKLSSKATARDDLRLMHTSEARLLAAISESWDPAAGMYHYRDYETHLSLPSASVLSFEGNGSFSSKRRFKQPRRLVVRIDSQGERSSAVSMTVYGYTQKGDESEFLSPADFAWRGSQAHLTTNRAFLAIERIEAHGLSDHDRVRVFTPDYTLEDISLFLPLWAGISHAARARQMVETALLTRFWDQYGAPISPGMVDSVSLPWNTLVADGLLRYGYRKPAADLFARMMAAPVSALKQQQAFYQSYHSSTGQPSGERGHLHGIPPAGLLLRILGIPLIRPDEIRIDGFNPFPEPVAVQYRQVHLWCYDNRTEIAFPAGQRVIIDRPGLHRVTFT